MTRAPRGFTIVELLIAMAVMTTIGGMFVSLMIAWQAIARSQPEAADQQQRARMAIQALSADLARAGAGVDRGALAGPLSRHFPAVEPSPGDAVTIWYVAGRDAQSTLNLPLLRGDGFASVADPSGFAPDSTAIVYDASGCRDVIRVEQVVATAIVLRGSPRRCDYAPGAALARAEVRTYRVDRATRQLLRRDEATGTTVPVVDGISQMSIEYPAAGRVRISLVITAAAPGLHDLSAVFDVAAPNLWLS